MRHVLFTGPALALYFTRWLGTCGAGKHQYFKIVIVTMMAISVEVKLIEKFQFQCFLKNRE